MNWLQEYDFSDAQKRSVVAGMKAMSSIDGDVDPQEVELIESVAEGLEGEFTLELSVFDTVDSKEQFLYWVTFVALVDTNIHDTEWALLSEYVEALGVDKKVQHFIDVVGESFLKQVFADSELLAIWVPRLKEDLRISEEVVGRLLTE